MGLGILGTELALFSSRIYFSKLLFFQVNNLEKWKSTNFEFQVNNLDKKGMLWRAYSCAGAMLHVRMWAGF